MGLEEEAAIEWSLPKHTDLVEQITCRANGTVPAVAVYVCVRKDIGWLRQQVSHYSVVVEFSGEVYPGTGCWYAQFDRFSHLQEVTGANGLAVDRAKLIRSMEAWRVLGMFDLSRSGAVISDVFTHWLRLHQQWPRYDTRSTQWFNRNKAAMNCQGFAREFARALRADYGTASWTMLTNWLNADTPFVSAVLQFNNGDMDVSLDGTAGASGAGCPAAAPTPSQPHMLGPSTPTYHSYTTQALPTTAAGPTPANPLGYGPAPLHPPDPNYYYQQPPGVASHPFQAPAYPPALAPPPPHPQPFQPPSAAMNGDGTPLQPHTPQPSAPSPHHPPPPHHHALQMLPHTAPGMPNPQPYGPPAPLPTHPPPGHPHAPCGWQL